MAIGIGVPVSPAYANIDKELVQSCRSVLAATEPAARRHRLERELFAYELRATLGASKDEMRIYRARLRESCTRFDHNNRRLRARQAPTRTLKRTAP